MFIAVCLLAMHTACSFHVGANRKIVKKIRDSIKNWLHTHGVSPSVAKTVVACFFPRLSVGALVNNSAM
jgi:DNA gyrase inhibitor GyrI